MAIACLWRKGIKLEKNLKVVLVIMGLAILMKAFYNYWSLFLKYEDESTTLKFALWNLQIKSSGLMELAFLIIIAKIFALLIAFSRRRLSRSLESIKKSNTIIHYVSVISFFILLVDDLTIVIIYFQNKDDEEWKIETGTHVVTFNLISLMFGASFNVIVLFLLWPMSHMFKKAIHL